jgi:hypothetical protein
MSIPIEPDSDEPYSRRISLSVPYYPANLFVILVRFVIFWMLLLCVKPSQFVHWIRIVSGPATCSHCCDSSIAVHLPRYCEAASYLWLVSRSLPRISVSRSWILFGLLWYVIRWLLPNSLLIDSLTGLRLVSICVARQSLFALRNYLTAALLVCSESLAGAL